MAAAKHTHQRQQQAVMASRQEIRSGPLPSQQEFDGYERTLPGAAERILSMAELEQRRSHKLATNEQWLRIFGAISGFVLGLAGLSIAIYMVHLDRAHVEHVVYAIAAVIGVALTGRVILGKRSQS